MTAEQIVSPRVRPLDRAAAASASVRGGIYVDRFCTDCGLGLVERFGGSSPARCSGCEKAHKEKRKALARHCRTVRPDQVQALLTGAHSLSAWERRVLSLFYGLDGEQRHTLDGVGRLCNITRERVRQIRDQAVLRLILDSEAEDGR